MVLDFFTGYSNGRITFLFHLPVHVVHIDFVLGVYRVTQLPDGIYATVQLIALLSQLMGPI